MDTSAPLDRRPSAGHVDTIDSLRAFAALAVCLYHLVGEAAAPLTVPVLRWVFLRGWVGVEIFFVISGFIIPYTMMRDGYRLRDYGGFIGRRLVRVVPPSWVLILFTVAFAFGVDAVRGGSAWSAAFSLPRVLHSMAYTIPFTRYAWTNGVLWTLAVELQFYLLLGLLFGWMFSGRTAFVLVAAGLCLLRLLPLPAGFLFASSAPLFAMGGAALMQREGRMGRGLYLAILAALALATWAHGGPIRALFGTATALVISFVPIRSRIGGFLGRISYSLYLVHPTVGGLTAAALVRLVHPAGLGAALAILGASVAAAIVGAWLFHRLVEVYFVGLSRRLFGRKRDAEPSL